MWLAKMEAKAKGGKYLSVEDFRADIEQIGVNARTYNTQGKFKFPGAATNTLFEIASHVKSNFIVLPSSLHMDGRCIFQGL